MILVKLQGGLGNQMFQYAAAKGIYKNKSIYVDLSFLKKHTQSTATFTRRKFELGLFPNIKLNFAGILKGWLFVRPTIISDDNVDEYLNKCLIAHNNIYLDGYFQNEKYFSNIRGNLLRDFEFPQLTGYALNWAQQISAVDNNVSVHIRRGDYLKAETMAFHGILPTSYYQQAVTIIDKKVLNSHYFVFSDDPEWCESNLPFLEDRVTIVKNNSNVWEDMYLMSICKHHIIANSSYSWWGAWLNKNTNKIVVAPSKWFANEPTDIVPEGWIKI
jgi:hypothetical protein